MTDTPKWKADVIAQEIMYTNRELLDEVMYLAGGDDYDGEFTAKGQWTFSYLQSQLYKRLKDWLNE